MMIEGRGGPGRIVCSLGLSNNAFRRLVNPIETIMHLNETLRTARTRVVSTKHKEEPMLLV